jgi:hypothetical protein
LADVDVFARVAVGRLIVRDGAVALQDPFAFTPTLPVWYDHEWLAGLIFYAVSQLGGDLGLFLFGFGCAVTTLAVIAAAGRQLVVCREEAVIGLIWCAVGMSIAWLAIVRAQSFTLLGLAATYAACIRYRTRGDARWLAVLPLLMVGWANVHAGFVAGMGALAVTAFALYVERHRGWWRVALCLVGCAAAAAFLNPYGPAYLQFIGSAVTKQRIAIGEWQPLPLGSAEAALLIGLVAVAGVAARKSPRSVPLEGRVLLAITLWLGLRHHRHIALFFLTAATYGMPYIVAGLQIIRRRLARRYLAVRRALVVVIAADCLFSLAAMADLAWKGPAFRLRYPIHPVQAMEWLREHRSGGRLLAHFNHGSYALWRGYPKFKIAVDGRYETVYPESTVYEAMMAFSVDHPDSPKAVRAIDPDYILVCESSTTRAFAMGFGPDWVTIYDDPECRIHAKTLNPDGTVGGPSRAWPAIWRPVF